MDTQLADSPENTGTCGIITAYQEQRQVAGQLTLDQHIGVRIPGGQPIQNKRLTPISPPLQNPDYDVNYDIGHSVRRRNYDVLRSVLHRLSREWRCAR